VKNVQPEIGQSRQFIDFLFDLAAEADEAKREL